MLGVGEVQDQARGEKRKHATAEASLCVLVVAFARFNIALNLNLNLSLCCNPLPNSLYFIHILGKFSSMRRILALLVPALLSAGCIQSIAVSTVGNIADQGFSAITEEGDLDFAEKALPGNIKLLEVMLKNDPENEKLLTLVSEGYSSYALAYLEDSLQDRARDFYARGRDHGLRILRKDSDIAKALGGTPDDLKEALAGKGIPPR